MRHYVLDAMNRNPVLTAPGQYASAAAAMARRRGVRHVIVSDSMRAVGVASVDELERAGGGDVASVASSPVVTVEDTEPVEHAEAIMDRYDVDCLPVVNWAGLLVGVITRGDVRRDGVEDAAEPRCAACGAREDVRWDEEAQIGFCGECASRGRSPTSPGDELYFTLGGG